MAPLSRLDCAKRLSSRFQTCSLCMDALSTSCGSFHGKTNLDNVWLCHTAKRIGASELALATKLPARRKCRDHSLHSALLGLSPSAHRISASRSIRRFPLPPSTGGDASAAGRSWEGGDGGDRGVLSHLESSSLWRVPSALKGAEKPQLLGGDALSVRGVDAAGNFSGAAAGLPWPPLASKTLLVERERELGMVLAAAVGVRCCCWRSAKNGIDPCCCPEESGARVGPTPPPPPPLRVALEFPPSSATAAAGKGGGRRRVDRKRRVLSFIRCTSHAGTLM